MGSMQESEQQLPNDTSRNLVVGDPCSEAREQQAEQTGIRDDSNNDTECLISPADATNEQVVDASCCCNMKMIFPSNDGGTGPIGGAMMIVNAALGAGLLNFPIAFHEAGGVVAANIVQAVMLCFIFPALLALAICSDWHKSATLQEVLSTVYGKKLERICSICVLLYCLGTCTTFLIIVGDQFDRTFASLYGPYFCHEWYMSRTFTVIASSVCFILPFCYAKKIDFLKHISSVGVVSVIYVAVLIIFNYYNGDYVPGDIKTSPDSWTDTFLVVPTLCFGYQCHVSAIPIYSCYKNRNIKTFAWSSVLALTICVFMYTVAATYGYLTFGSKIESDILSSYDAKDPYVMVAILIIGIKAFTTYPLISFCGIAAVSDLWVESQAAQGVLQVDPRIKERFRIISVTIWFTGTLAFAVFLPNISSAIKFLGSLAALFIFVFPGMCLLKLAESTDGITVLSKPRRWIQAIAGVFLIAGAFLFGVVMTNAIIYNFFDSQSKSDPDPLCLPLN